MPLSNCTLFIYFSEEEKAEVFEDDDRLRKEEWDEVVTLKKDAKAPVWKHVH